MTLKKKNISPEKGFQKEGSLPNWIFQMLCVYVISSGEYCIQHVMFFMVNISCHENQIDPRHPVAILQSYQLRRCEFGIPKSRKPSPQEIQGKIVGTTLGMGAP